MPRPSRAEVERRQRRRRDDDINGYRLRLSIPDKYSGDPNNEYRWINDDRGRVEDLTQRDDWDVVKADDIEGHDSANTVRRRVGTKPDGKPLFAQLVRKPKEFCEEDRMKRQRRLDRQMDALASGRRGDRADLGSEEGYVATDSHVRDGRKS